MYAKHGEGNWKAPIEKEVTPGSDKCVTISTRSSVREMVAPGTYAVLRFGSLFSRFRIKYA